MKVTRTFSKEHFFDLDLIRTKDYFKRLTVNGSIGTCIVCAKPSNESGLFVHMLTNGMLTDLSEQEVGEDSQGCFEIGSSCARKLPKSFITKEDRISQ
jgi:hypothetical protein